MKGEERKRGAKHCAKRRGRKFVGRKGKREKREWRARCIDGIGRQKFGGVIHAFMGF